MFEVSEGSSTKPRSIRIITVEKRLRKYKKRTRNFRSRKVILKITTSLTLRIIIGRMYLLLSKVSSWVFTKVAFRFPERSSSVGLKIWMINFLINIPPEHCSKQNRDVINTRGLYTVGELIGIFSFSKFSLSQDLVGLLCSSKLSTLLNFCLKFT